jgi:muramidase (phage lysozyme)
MDEEELGQSNKKITIDNFFESISSIDEVANRALQQSQENFNLVSVNSNLLQGLEESIQLIESDIQQITNYFIVQQDQRRKQLEIREQELSKRQDISQKQIGGRLQDVAPFENRPTNFGDSLLQGVAGLAQNTIRPFIGPGVILGLSGLLGFKDGGEPPINKPSIVGEEGPEIFVPKTSGTIIPNNITNELNTNNIINESNTSNFASNFTNQSNTNNFASNFTNQSNTNNFTNNFTNELNTNNFTNNFTNELNKSDFTNNFTNNFLAQNIQNNNQTNINKKINTQALLNTISVAEGTAKGGYGTIYGGTDDNPITVPELAAGEMTINQVLNMMKTGKIERTRMVENDKGEMVEEKYMADVGYGKENNVGATGKYQFIPAALEEEVGVMMKKDKDLSLDSLLTPQLQDKLMLQRLKEKRKIDFGNLEGGIKNITIDKLSEEFESFPNLLPGSVSIGDKDLGPVKGRTDQSFYDIKGDKAPVRSEKFIKSVFESQVDKLTLPPNEDLSAITLPPISSGGNDEPIETTSPTFETSNSQSDQITGTESGIPFIDVISNPFLSVV